jgi:predicted transglutaminase-like cysteine proteinase
LLLCASPVQAFDYKPTALSTLVARNFGALAQGRFDQWVGLLHQLRGEALETQLGRVNMFWNVSLDQQEDSVVWHMEDYWATPLESLGKGAGDCEDFVIGKYFSLLWLGVAPNQLRLIYVNARVNTAGRPQVIPHMVLGYYPSPMSQPLILDSLVNKIVAGDERPDLKPVFSFNGDGIYMAGATEASAQRIGRWRSLLARMRAQGFEL